MSTLVCDSEVLLSLGNCLSFLMQGGLILDVCLPSAALRRRVWNSWKETSASRENFATSDEVLHGSFVLQFFSSTYSIYDG